MSIQVWKYGLSRQLVGELQRPSPIRKKWVGELLKATNIIENNYRGNSTRVAKETEHLDLTPPKDAPGAKGGKWFKSDDVDASPKCPGGKGGKGFESSGLGATERCTGAKGGKWFKSDDVDASPKCPGGKGGKGFESSGLGATERCTGAKGGKWFKSDDVDASPKCPGAKGGKGFESSGLGATVCAPGSVGCWKGGPEVIGSCTALARSSSRTTSAHETFSRPSSRKARFRSRLAEG